MTISNELRVGIMFLTGLILLVLVIVTLTRWGQTRRTYSFTIRFKQAQGLEEGAAVQVSGVKVGQVSDITLDPKTNEPLVTVLVDRQVKLRKGYTYAIGVGGIVGEKYVDILRPASGGSGGAVVKENSEVQGFDRVDMNVLLDSANSLVAQLTIATGSLNRIIGSEGNQQNLREMIANMNDASRSTAQFARLMNDSMIRNKAGLDETMANMRSSSKSAAEFTASLNAMMIRNQTEVDQVMANLRQGSASAAEFTSGLSDVMQNNKQVMDLIIANLGKTSDNTVQLTAAMNATMQRNQQAIDLIVANMQGVTTDLRAVSTTLSTKVAKGEMFDNLEAAAKHTAGITERLDSIATAVSEMINDKTLGDDVRNSVANLRQASEDLQQLVADARDAAAPFPEVSANLRDITDDLRNITAPVKEIAPETTQNILQIARNLRSTSDSLTGSTSQLSRLGKILRETTLRNQAQLMAISSPDRSTRADLNMDILGPRSMVRVGLADVGFNDRFNLQFGSRLGKKDDWVRYGLIQSSFGVGIDKQLNPNLRLTGELFTPGDVRANALINYRLSSQNDWWLSAGWYDLFDRDSTAFGAGVLYRPGK